MAIVWRNSLTLQKFERRTIVLEDNKKEVKSFESRLKERHDRMAENIGSRVA